MIPTKGSLITSQVYLYFRHVYLKNPWMNCKHTNLNSTMN